MRPGRARPVRRPARPRRTASGSGPRPARPRPAPRSTSSSTGSPRTAPEGARAPGVCAATCSARPAVLRRIPQATAATIRALRATWRTSISASARSSSDLGESPAARRSYLAAKTLYEALTTAKPDDRGLPGRSGRIAVPHWATMPRRSPSGRSCSRPIPTTPAIARDLADAYNSLAIAQAEGKKIAEATAVAPEGPRAPRGPGPRLPRRSRGPE